MYIFWDEDAEVILALLVHGGRANTLAWHFDKHGIFSVKSAYKVNRQDMLTSQHKSGGQGGSTNDGKGVWKDIWKLKCPNKIKHFLWRLTHNGQPLRCNLSRRGMLIDTRCPVCGQMSEDGGHLFFKCKLPKQIWRILNFENERQALAAIPDAYDVVDWILKQQGQKRDFMVIILWFIWTERNNIREEGVGGQPQ